jgi:predicted RNase H-like HicB family nuclease
MHQYIAIVREVSITGQLDVEFPDLSGCDTTGSTMAEVKLKAAEALTLHLQRMIADGEVPPRASTLEEIMKDANNHDGEAIVVTASV